MNVKTYEVFDHKGLLLHSDKEGEKYKYLARCVDLRTGKETRHDREAMFLNHSCFRACLDRWNYQGQNAVKNNSHFKWTYISAKL